MVSPRDSHIVELWLERQASPHTRAGATGAIPPVFSIMRLSL